MLRDENPAVQLSFGAPCLPKLKKKEIENLSVLIVINSLKAG
jgi:hypothetical protein